MIRPLFAIVALLTITTCVSTEQQKPQPTQQLENTFVVEDQAWNSTFLRDEGVFGVDGIFAIPLNGKEFVPPSSENDSTLFVFSDSLVKLKGKIKNNQLTNKDYKMIHNSLGMAVGQDPQSSLEFFFQGSTEKPETVFHPEQQPGEVDHYYWLGDGFVNTAADSSLYIFAYEIVDVETDGFFSFEQLGVAILKIDKAEKYPYQNYEVIETDLMFEVEGRVGKTTFGNAILVNTEEAGAPYPDGYIYVYGTVGFEKALLVARVKPDQFENVETWTFWNGEEWTTKKTEAEKLVLNVSNEMSVSPLPKGQFILVYQNAGMEPAVMMQLAKSPIGPFYPPKSIYQAPEIREDKDFFAYNAKGHPSLSEPDSLLISYNVNSFDFFVDVLTKPNLYRPRFIKISLD